MVNIVINYLLSHVLHYVDTSYHANTFGKYIMEDRRSVMNCIILNKHFYPGQADYPKLNLFFPLPNSYLQITTELKNSESAIAIFNRAS